jgi:O-antigen/teichoic acid export membrane protein
VSAPDERPAKGRAGKEEGGHRGEGAVLGVRVLRYSGIQGVAMVGASVLHLVTIFVVAAFLGPSDLGRFAILYFGANLLAQILTIAVKPGTIRRTFGEGDEEDDDEDDEDVSASPQRSLGTGLILAAILALVGGVAAVLFREPIADWLLGDSDDADLIVWAAVLGATTVVFRLASIVIWFERRPGAFLACELARPILALGLVTGLLAGGAGLEAVLIGSAAGTVLAAVIGLAALRGSFDPVLDRTEALPIFQRGLIRAPIMMSFWLIVNADVFVLSRYVSDSDLGIYTLASRVAFIAAFLPQSFRVALRPLRKAAIYKSVEEQYGRAEQRGQLLGYFVLLCITAVLAMVLAGPVVVDIAPDSFGDAAPLIPIAAAAMVWPAMLRTVNQQTQWPGRTKVTFIGCAVVAAVLFVVVTALLAPEIDIYAAPVGMVVGLLPPCAYLFIRGQRGPDRIAFPYREVGTALAVAAVITVVYELLEPSLSVAADIVVAIALAALYVCLLFVLRVIPESHWEALSHMARSLASGRPDRFQPRRGLRALEQDDRDALRAAIDSSWAARSGSGQPPSAPAVADDGQDRLVRCLRVAGERGGVPVGGGTALDGEIGKYLFSAAPTAVRNATLRRLLDEGADAADLRALEDLIAHLASVPDDAWAGLRKNRGRAPSRS